MGEPSHIDSDGLIAYGIYTEQSDIRAHICAGEGYLYVAKTKSILEAMLKKPRKQIMGGQRNVRGNTYRAQLLPIVEIDGVLDFQIPQAVLDTVQFSQADDTNDKGDKAERVWALMWETDRILLPAEYDLVKGIIPQREGKDILVYGNQRVQVKCDYLGGIHGGSGNLCIQTHERNPRGKFSKVSIDPSLPVPLPPPLIHPCYCRDCKLAVETQTSEIAGWSQLSCGHYYIKTGGLET